ncbi:ubiquitin-like protein 7 [Uranotaenia lowii]|uniref:ubiquitin-like protein 7 n=1 Tax=Uranotaenia lowii TaxID=190385 RepID=UPI00247908CE|nr:ubiquitin-like protein 7 [Uranotaenia lowii]
MSVFAYRFILIIFDRFSEVHKSFSSCIFAIIALKILCSRCSRNKDFIFQENQVTFIDFEMPFVYLGVQLPFQPYKKIKLENFDLENKAEQLRHEAQKAIASIPADQFDFIYCGDLLGNDDVLKDKGVECGSTIHLIQKKKELTPPKSEIAFNEADVQEILGIWRTVLSSNFQKVRHPEFMKNVLDANPAIRNDLWALSILKDPILLSSMQQPETIRRVAEKHYILIEASRSIVQLLNSKMISKSATFSPTIESALDDALSDSSSSDENTSPTTSTGARSARRITADQLASALAFAGSSSFNSLSNISQRDADTRETTDPQTNQPSTSGSAPPANRITSSMFMNALSEVIQSARRPPDAESDSEPMDTSPSTDINNSNSTVPSTETTPSVAPGDVGGQAQSQHSTLEANLSRYRAELDQMREMGLTDTETNLQALIVCAGNVETAVNLVFSGMTN